MNEMNRQVEVEAVVLPPEDSVAQADARYANAHDTVVEEHKTGEDEVVDVEVSIVPAPEAVPALTTATPVRKP